MCSIDDLQRYSANIEVGQFASQILKDFGYVTTWATNSEGALDQLERGKAFDIIFSDVVMPGMGGIERAEQVRQRWLGLPGVLASGYSQILAQESTHGFELLHKPYSADQLSRVFYRVHSRCTVESGYVLTWASR